MDKIIRYLENNQSANAIPLLKQCFENPDSYKSTGNLTPLIIACKNLFNYTEGNRIPLLKLLIDKGSDINQTSKYGSPLTIIITYDVSSWHKYLVLDYLLNCRAKFVDEHNIVDQYSNLKRFDKNFMLWLIKKGLNVCDCVNLDCGL